MLGDGCLDLIKLCGGARSFIRSIRSTQPSLIHMAWCLLLERQGEQVGSAYRTCMAGLACCAAMDVQHAGVKGGKQAPPWAMGSDRPAIARTRQSTFDAWGSSTSTIGMVRLRLLLLANSWRLCCGMVDAGGRVLLAMAGGTERRNRN